MIKPKTQKEFVQSRYKGLRYLLLDIFELMEFLETDANALSMMMKKLNTVDSENITSDIIKIAAIVEGVKNQWLEKNIKVVK